MESSLIPYLKEGVFSATMDKTRIISMRKANVREQRIYQERFGQT
jgi:uncharacterized DUF497 family protein